MFTYAIEGVVNFSHIPLDMVSILGMIMTLIAFFSIVFVIARKLIWGDPVAGWASTICIITFIGGIQLFCMGVIGQYIAKMYMEVKKRPHYIVSETNNDKIKRVM